MVVKHAALPPGQPTVSLADYVASSTRRRRRGGACAVSLGSTRRINLDFGRETGTWMPPRWAINAGRTEFTLDLTFEDARAASVSTPALRGLAPLATERAPVERACGASTATRAARR